MKLSLDSNLGFLEIHWDLFLMGFLWILWRFLDGMLMRMARDQLLEMLQGFLEGILRAY